MVFPKVRLEQDAVGGLQVHCSFVGSHVTARSSPLRDRGQGRYFARAIFHCSGVRSAQAAGVAARSRARRRTSLKYSVGSMPSICNRSVNPSVGRLLGFAP